jgi:hypothetical protein
MQQFENIIDEHNDFTDVYGYRTGQCEQDTFLK